MRTKNFKTMMAMMFERCAVNKGMLPMVGRDGVTYYAGPSTGAGYQNPGWAFQLNPTYAGFCVGTGATAESENDYELESMITAGLSASVVTNPHLDEDDYPSVDFDLTITNVSSETITIAEIGMKQPLSSTTELDGTAFGNRVFLIDRTVLEHPVSIPAGEYAIIRYTFTTSI
jgi:hypothetical protein